MKSILHSQFSLLHSVISAQPALDHLDIETPQNLSCYDSRVNFDAVDRRILEVLREQGRASHAALAKEVGLSAPAVGERVKKLEQSGVIAGYAATFHPEALGLGICAFVSIAPQPRNPGANLVENLRAMPEIEELHAVAGPYGYIAKVRVSTPEELDAFLDRLWVLEGVERTETTMVLRTSVERPMYLPFTGS